MKHWTLEETEGILLVFFLRNHVALWRHDYRHSDTHHSDIQCNDNEHEDTQHNDTENEDTQYNGTQH
jgi:hypothetical protein